MKNKELVNSFIKAVKLFAKKPARLEQALRDATKYYKEGELTEEDIKNLRQLASQYS